MQKKIIWIAGALALIAIPAVIGLVALDGDDSSARRAGALVAVGGATAYQLQLTQATAGADEIREAIELESVLVGRDDPTTIGSHGGAGVGKVKFNDFKITKKVDRASPLLFKQMASGSHYKKAVLTLRKAGDKEPYMTYTMDTVFVSNVDHGGGSPEVASEEITFVYGTLVVLSNDRNADGSLAPPVQAGWDQVTNRSAP